MAELEGLYFGMGIDTSQLNSDFVDAEKTINQNIARINKEMKLIQLHGQIELEGLDESAASAEKLRIQEEALNEQMALQQDKIVMLSAVYDHLSNTKGENAEVTKKVEMQLAREQLAMQRLEQQTKDLSKQTEIALGVQFEMLGLIEPAIKAIDSAVAAGRTLPIPAPQAKAAAAATIGLLSVAEGSREATEELREANPAKILDEDFQRAAVSVDDSWQRINESNRRGYAEMQSYQRNYHGYRKQQYQQWHSEINEAKNELKTLEKEQAGILESFAKFIGVKDSEEGGLKIAPDVNRNDILRFAKVLEDYRFSEGLSAGMDLFKESDSVIGKLAATIVNFWYVTTKAQAPIAEFAETVINNFRELSKAATELNLPLDKANEIMTKINLAGADYNDVRDYVRGVQDAIIKGDSEDPEVLALEKYGVTIQDAQGKLLAFDETLERLYQGYLKAREAGEAEAYVIMTNGQAVQDVLPYFENLAKAEEDMAKIKWATLDSATLSNVSREMKLFETQTQELSNALSSVFAPAAEMAFKNMFEDQKALTELIEENREEIIYWSYVVMEALEAAREFKKELSSGLKDGLSEAYEALSGIDESLGLTDKLKSFFADEPKKEIGEEAKEYFIPFYEELKKLEEEFGVISKLEHFLPEGFTDELDNVTNEYLVPFYETIKSIEEELSITNKLKSAVADFLPEGFGNLFDGEDSIFARAQKDFEEYKKVNEEARDEIEKTDEALAGLSYSLNRIAKYKTELESLELDIEFGSGESYWKKIEQEKIWYEQADEQAIIEEVQAARLIKIEQEKEQKLAEIREKITAADRTELENRILAINHEKDEWIKAGMEKVEAEQSAQKQLTDYIKKTEEELSNNLSTIYGTELENRLAQIEKERQAWIDKCGDEVKATQLAEQAKADAQRNAAMSVLKQQAEEYEAYQKGGYAGLRAYKANQLAEQGVNPDYLYMTPQQLQEFQKASQVAEKSMMPNFMTEHDRAEHYQQMQDWQDWKRQRYEEIDKDNYVIVDGVKRGISEVLQGTPIEISLGKNDREEEHTLRVSSEGDSYTKTDSRYSYDKQGNLTESQTQFREGTLPIISEEMTQPLIESFAEIPPAVQGVTKTFQELPTVIQGIYESLSEIAEPQIDSSINPFSDLESIIQSVIQSFSEFEQAIQSKIQSISSFGQEIPNVIQSLSGMNSGFSEVTVKLSDLSQALANFILPQQEQNEKVPVEVNTTVQIDEAHAWDYDHIQELADKVANMIKPEILSAIGGDSNSY